MLKAVVPPLMLTSTMAPALPEDWSQARKVTEAVVPLMPSGTKRRRSVERSSRADVSLTAPTADQLVPPSSEYCHVPVLLFKAVRPIPCGSPALASVTMPLMIVETRSPLLLVWSSVIVVKLLAPLSTGALFGLLLLVEDISATAPRAQLWAFPKVQVIV